VLRALCVNQNYPEGDRYPEKSSRTVESAQTGTALKSKPQLFKHRTQYLQHLMKISIIVAMTRDRVIGKNGTMPWHLPAEIKYFKWVTMGKPIVMGRKTFDSFRRVLPGRQNIVITRDPSFKFEGVEVVHSVDEALAIAGSGQEIMIIGGSDLYRQTMDRADRIYVTLIEADIEGDTFFPEIDFNDWREVENVFCAGNEQNVYSMKFLILEKLGS
jgi:dihydrofolate reductase